MHEVAASAGGQERVSLEPEASTTDTGGDEILSSTWILSLLSLL